MADQLANLPVAQHAGRASDRRTLGTFGSASGDPDGQRAHEPGKLAQKGPDRPARRGHNHRLAGLGLPDDLHPRNRP